MRRAISTCALAAAFAAGITACGDDGAPDGAASGDGNGERATLNVAIAAAAVGVLERIAAHDGLFDANGVDVTLQEGTGQNTPNILAAGRADVAVFSIGAPATLAQKGQDISIIYALTGGSQSGSVFVSTKPGAPKSLDELKRRDGCTIVTQATGSAAYGNAVKYNQSLGLGCEVSPLADPAAQIGAVAAGRADAIVGTIGNFTSAIEEDRLAVIVDTAKPADRERYLGENYPLAVEFGIADRLKDKRDAVERYLKAIDAAAKTLKETPTDELVEQLKDSAGYEGMTPDAIGLSLDEFKEHFQNATDGGHISDEQWARARAALQAFDVPGLTAETPQIAYDRIVDMSYYERALGAPAAADGADR